MTIPRSLRKYIEAGNLEAVESEWLAHVEENPHDVEFFVSVVRAMKGSGEETAAKTLLELLYDEWQDDSFSETRLKLLKAVGQLMLAPTELHDEIVHTLGGIYAEFPSYDGLLEKSGLDKAVGDIPKTWSKVTMLRTLLDFEVGSIVWMEGKGAGRVVEVNLQLDSFKVDLERSPGLRVGFRGAGKLMHRLSKDHILRRKIEDPEPLRALKKDNPSELLLTALRSYDAPRAAAQIRESLAGIVSESEWTSWWGNARKNPQVLAQGKGARQLYSAAASSEDAEEAVMLAFDRAPLDSKLELFKRNADRSGDFKAALATKLAHIAAGSSSAQLDLRFAIAHALRDEAELMQDASWGPEEMISSADSPADLLAKLSDWSARERGDQIVRASRSDWQEIYLARLETEVDPRVLTALAGALEQERQADLVSFYDRVLNQARKFPGAFVWMTERAQNDDLILERKPLRFMQTLLATSPPKELEPYGSRMRKVMEDGGPLAKLIQGIEPEQASTAEELLARSSLEEYLATPLTNALHMRFPALRPEEESALYATLDSIATRKTELRILKEEEIPANRRAIEEAREMGDLRENFEYKSARQRHEYLNARLARLQLDLESVRPIDLEREDSEEVRVASKVKLRLSDGNEQSYVILGPWESNPEEDVISYDSELARALLGGKLGDVREFSSETYEIIGLEAWHG